LRFVVLRLVPHPDTPAGAVEGIEARVERASSHLSLVYMLRGDLGRMRIPAPSATGFTDGLWNHTCCEAFVAGADGYDEFNLSPSGAFAAYRFSGYRAGMRRLEGHVRVSWRKGVLEALVPLRADARRLALSAVIEETSGALSYWALRHAAGKPDFHHADAFTHPLDEDRP
jgi:hypothetical protein